MKVVSTNGQKVVVKIEKWPEENRQIDLIIVTDTIAWLIGLSVYSSVVNRNNGWRTMTVV